MPNQRHHHPIILNAKIDRIGEGFGEDTAEFLVNFTVGSREANDLGQLSPEGGQKSVAQLAPAHLVIPSHRIINVVPDFRKNAKLFHPRLALIQPRLKADTLELRAPGMLRLEIPLDLPAPEDERTLEVLVWDEAVKAYDCDAVTAAWFSQAIGVPCRLVRFHPEGRRLASTKWTGAVEAPTLFADAFPLLIASTASLADVNAKLEAAGRDPIPMNRFRPNIVIDGIDAFEEDYTDTFTVGEVILKPVKPCGRCTVPSVDQASGTRGPDPLDILQSYRGKPQLDGEICFGMNAIVLAGDGQRLTVGQTVELALAF